MANSGMTVTSGHDMHVNRMGHYTALLPDGQAVLFGGHGTGFVSLNTSELYDPAADTLRLCTMNDTRDAPAIARLTDGRYLLAGGAANLGVAPGNTTAEFFNPADNSFTAVTGTMTYGRMTACAAALNDSLVLIVGGWYNASSPKYPELFNVHTQMFSLTDSLSIARAWPLVLPTTDGKAVVFGGVGSYGAAISQTAELYDPATNKFSVLSDTLFGSIDTGWNFGSLASYNRTLDQQKMKDGTYLLSAGKGYEYTLLTFNPVTREFKRVATTPAKFHDTTMSLYPPLVDTLHNRAYVLGSAWDSVSSRYYLCCYTVNLSTWTVMVPDSRDTLPALYFISGVGFNVLKNGTVLMIGGHSQTGYNTNFSPIISTKLIVPDTTLPVVKADRGAQREGNALPCFSLHYVSGTITLNAPVSSPVTVTLFDCSGRSTAKIFQGSFKAGEIRKIPVGKFKLPPGMYVYMIKSVEKNRVGTIALW